MATIATLTSGDWSDTATWDGGVLPGAGDTAQVLTTHVVTIDQNVAVDTLTSTGSGKFVVTGSTAVSIECTSDLTMVSTSTSSLIEFDASYSAVGSSITAPRINAHPHTGTGAQGLISILDGATGSLEIESGSDIIGDSHATGGYLPAINCAGDVDLTVTAAGSILSNHSSSQAILLSGTSGASIVVNASKLEFVALRLPNGAIWHITINADIESSMNQAAVFITGGASIGTLTVNGDIYRKGAGGSGLSLSARTLDSVTINGNIINETTGSTQAVVLYSVSEATITGDIIGGGGSVIPSLNNSALVFYDGNLTINGDVYGPRGVYMAHASGNLLVNGDLYSGSSKPPFSNTGYAVGGQTSASITIEGDIYAADITNSQASSSSSSFGVLGTQSATVPPVRLGKIGSTTTLYNTRQQSAAQVPYMITSGAGVVHRYGRYSESGVFIDEAPALTNVDSDLAPSDVREGIVYDSDSKVGTMAVPAPEDVYYGVPVDHTVGTATVKMTDAAAVTGSQISSLSA